MPRTSILIPVKSTARAKGRLGTLLDQATRQQLSLHMLEDVLAAVMPAVGTLVEAVYVATSDAEAMPSPTGTARRSWRSWNSAPKATRWMPPPLSAPGGTWRPS